MLKKVIKYEWQASGRLLWPLSALVVGLACLIRLAVWLTPLINETAGVIVSSLVSVLAPMIASIILFAFLIILVVRFYQGMSSNEAYLTFTLPVKVSTHIWGRSIVGTIFSIVSGVVTLIFYLIAVPGFASEVWEVFQSIPFSLPIMDSSSGIYEINITHGVAALIILAVLLFMLISYINSLLQMYASVAIGSQFGRSRAIGTVVGYFILSTVQGIISVVVVAAVCVPLVLNRMESISMAPPSEVAYWIMSIVGIGVLIFTAVTILITVIYFILTKHLFVKKLNLE